METLYIFTDGDLRRKNNALYLKPKNNKMKALFVPLKSVSSLMIFSEVTINKKFLDILSKEGIPAFFYGYYGNFIGSFYPEEINKTGEMLVLQFKHYEDLNKRMRIAIEILNAAVKNMINLLSDYKEVTKNEIEYIKKLKDTFEKQQNIPALMAIEGNIRRAYYSAIGKIVGKRDFKFLERVKRPPKDEINALISFGNVVLYNIVLAEIYKTSLEPRLSFLHEPNKRKFSLQLDISEIFKPLIVDKVILKMINNNMIKKSDFENVNDGVYLSKEGKKKFVQELENRLEKRIYLYRDQKVTFKTVILHECYKLIRHLKGEDNYKGFVLKEWWNIRYILVVYDINEKRVNKIHKVLKKYIVWQQNSTFEGNITQANLKRMMRELNRKIDPDEDSIVIYFFNSKNVFKKEVDGVEKWELSNNFIRIVRNML